MQPLRILAFGAGAIGTYIGGSLAIQGHHVVFLERPEIAAELRERGLRLKLGENEHRLPHPHLTASLIEALAGDPFEAGIFALKSYDTAAALESFAPFAAQMPPVLCLQNGVDNEALLTSVLGPERVIAGTVTSAIGRRGTGDIILERLRGVGLADDHPSSPILAAAFQGAGLNARLYPQAASMKWSKMVTNLLANATSAILNMTPAEIFSHPRLFALEIRQLREVLAVMDALGLQVVDLPGTPVRLLAFAVRSLPPALSRPFLARAVGSGRGEKMPSFHIDLYSGRGRSEVDHLNGAVVRQGEKLGVPTPVNRLLNETLLALTASRISPDSFARRPEKLLALQS